MNNNIYYCTVSQTRGLSAEMPIGNPLGGPAYSKREMPVVIVALAAYSFAAGAAIAATSMVIGGAMMVGAALTIVGTITGNQELTKIGGIISLVGGVAGLAEGAFGAAAQSAAGDGAVQLSGPGMETAAEGAISGSAPVAADGATQLAGPGMDGIADTAMNAGGSAGPSVTDTSMPINDAAAQKAAADASTAVDPAANPFTATAKDTMAVQAPSENSAFQVSGGNDISGGLINSNPADATKVGTNGYFDKLGNFVEKNKAMTDIGLKVVGGLIPTNETEAKTELNRAQTERIRQMTEDERRRALWRRGLINQ